MLWPLFFSIPPFGLKLALVEELRAIFELLLQFIRCRHSTTFQGFRTLYHKFSPHFELIYPFKSEISKFNLYQLVIFHHNFGIFMVLLN